MESTLNYANYQNKETRKSRKVFRTISFFFIFLGVLTSLFFEIYTISTIADKPFIKGFQEYAAYIKFAGISSTLLGMLIFSFSGHKKWVISIFSVIFMFLAIANFLFLSAVPSLMFGLRSEWEIPYISELGMNLMEGVVGYINIIYYGIFFLTCLVLVSFIGTRKPRLLSFRLLSVGATILLITTFTSTLMEGLKHVESVWEKLSSGKNLKYVQLSLSGLLGVSYIISSVASFIGFLEAKKD